MKTFLKFLPVAIILFSFSNCASGKKLQENEPLDVKQVYCSTTTGDVRGAGSLITLIIPVEEMRDVVLDSVYFRGKKAALKKESSQKNLYIAHFKIPSADREDLIMHSDPKKEYGNKPPVILPDIPFELEADEAVIKFYEEGEEKYFKITGIKQDDSGPILRKKPENIRH